MEYNFRCKCGKQLHGKVDKGDNRVRCRCGKAHIVNAAEPDHFAATGPKMQHAKSAFRPGKERLVVPATLLMILSTIAVFGNLFVLSRVLTLEGEQLDFWAVINPTKAISDGFENVIRIGHPLLALACNAFMFIGASNMKRGRHIESARIAAILAMVPTLGPCVCFALPTGIWCLVLLASRDGRAVFVD